MAAANQFLAYRFGRPESAPLVLSSRECPVRATREPRKAGKAAGPQAHRLGGMGMCEQADAEQALGLLTGGLAGYGVRPPAAVPGVPGNPIDGPSIAE
jgi:hypothetical protein